MPSISDLLREIEEDETESGIETESEKTASETDFDSMADEVMRRAMEKVAAVLGGFPKGEVAPEEMAIQTQEAVSPEEMAAIQSQLGIIQESAGSAVDRVKEVIKSNILQAGKAVVDDATAELSMGQVEKIAAVKDQFETQARGELFEKIAATLVKPRIVIDENFAKEQTANGKLKALEQFFNFRGERVNRF